jgi:hypothetical protein
MSNTELPNPDEPEETPPEVPGVERRVDADGNTTITIGGIQITTVRTAGRVIPLGVPAPDVDPEQN